MTESEVLVKSVAELEKQNARLMRQIESMKPFVCTKIVCKDREKTRFCQCCGQKI